ncbi:hypothetical protein PHYSODRAFT_254090 [Phytophthora sojae]|uniref:Uncharacterized protein n=1 Tax=Phytophthora sojae (strain P6497) TaxID=1094619 RepID=G5A8K5_PHYSP|nr:hypothetical protein PHYSODRAFT_254090 [Phytophthora sojae]EGZ08231.1 hypothetical protein PHYSODRAFT_254090 [Phytophthora sojae]|eukprot:XP_009536403.1 hypothetical protein PHYSODRAFT_254090 [Phytophthora sojae]
MARRASKSSPARPRAIAASADTAGAPASSVGESAPETSSDSAAAAAGPSPSQGQRSLPSTGRVVRRTRQSEPTRASKRLQKRNASDAPVPPASRTASSEGSSVEVGPTGDPADLVVASQSSPGANAKGQEPAPRRQAPGKRKVRKTVDHQTAALSIRRAVTLAADPPSTTEGDQENYPADTSPSVSTQPRATEGSTNLVSVSEVVGGPLSNEFGYALSRRVYCDQRLCE